MVPTLAPLALAPAPQAQLRRCCRFQRLVMLLPAAAVAATPAAAAAPSAAQMIQDQEAALLSPLLLLGRTRSSASFPRAWRAVDCAQMRDGWASACLQSQPMHDLRPTAHVVIASKGQCEGGREEG